MSEPKHFIVLGLGTFGTTLAARLSQNKCRVTGVDSCRAKVESLKDVLYEAVIADATERAAMEKLSLQNADAVFISLGNTIIPSLLATLHAKELGARRLIVKGLDDEHGRLLKHLGVERVIFPKIEVAKEVADRMTWPNVLDFVPIDSDHSLVEITVPDSWCGQTLADINVRRDFGVWVIGVKQVLDDKMIFFPSASFTLKDDQLLLAIGRQAELDRLKQVQ